MAASEDEKKGIAFLLLGLLIVLFVLTHFRIIKSYKSYLLILHLSNSVSWTLHPKTLLIDGCNIRIPLFTPVSHAYDRLERIAFRKPLRDDLYFYGTNLRGVNLSLKLTPMGDIVELYVEGDQELVMDGRRLLFSGYEKNYDYDEEEYKVTEYFTLLDFDPITLEDGTVITINNIGPECFLKMTATEWRLYVIFETKSFLLKNNRLKEDILVWDITFEPHFGKLLEYRLTEPERYFGDGRF
jgi:hypothetical protein